MTTHLNSLEIFHNFWSDHDCKILPLGLKGKLFHFTEFIYTFTAQPYQHQTGHLKLLQRKISLIKINICYWSKMWSRRWPKRMRRFFVVEIMFILLIELKSSAQSRVVRKTIVFLNFHWHWNIKGIEFLPQTQIF